MNVLQAIQYIIQGWNEVTFNTIKTCQNHVKIPNISEFADMFKNSYPDEVDDSLTMSL